MGLLAVAAQSVYLANAVLVAPPLAPVLLEVLDRARRSARSDGLRLPPELDLLEQQLRRLVGDVVVVEEQSTTWIPVAVAAARLRLSRERVGEMIRSGLLPGRRVGRGWLVDEQAVADEAAARGEAETAGFRQNADIA